MSNEKRTENIRGEVLDYDEESNSIVLKLHDEIDMQAINKLKVNGRYYTYLDFYDKRNISDAQRNYFHALMGDYAKHTGHLKESTTEMFKLAFMQEYDLPDIPSVSRNGITVTTARKLLQFTLEFFIENDIPFYEQHFYLAEDESRLYYALTINRICWICGKTNSEIHHAINLIGMGNDRNKHNHLKSRYMCLCNEHHEEAGSTPFKEFCDKYIIKPIKLDEKAISKLNMRGDLTNEMSHRKNLEE